MNDYLNACHFPTESAREHDTRAGQLHALVPDDMQGNLLAMLSNFRRILSDNHRRSRLKEVYANPEIARAYRFHSRSIKGEAVIICRKPLLTKKMKSMDAP